MPDQLKHQSPDLKETTTTTPVTPTWLADDPCPAWCAGDHPADQHPEDRAHMASVAHVPVVRAGRPPYLRGHDTAEAAEYVIVMRRYVDQTDTWVYIGEGEDTTHSVEVTVESARRIAVALNLLLSRVDQ